MLALGPDVVSFLTFSYVQFGVCWKLVLHLQCAHEGDGNVDSELAICQELIGWKQESVVIFLVVLCYQIFNLF